MNASEVYEVVDRLHCTSDMMWLDWFVGIWSERGRCSLLGLLGVG